MFNDQKTLESINLDRLETDYLTLDNEDRLDCNVYKDIIQNKLSTVQKRIFLLYIESGRLKSVAEILGCSTSRIFYLIKEIKDIIKKESQSEYYKKKF